MADVIQRIEGRRDFPSDLNEIFHAVFVIKHDAGKVEELGARLDVSSVQMALGKVYIEIAGIQFNERSQVLAAAGYPRGKFFVELLFDLDEGHNRMLIQLIQKTAGKGVGRREGRKLGRSALHDAGSVQGCLGHFFDGFRINERLLVFVWQRIESFPFLFREAVSELFNPLVQIHACTLFAWSGGQPRYGAVGNAANVLCGRI